MGFLASSSVVVTTLLEVKEAEEDEVRTLGEVMLGSFVSVVLVVLTVEEEGKMGEMVGVCVLGLQTVLCCFQCLVWHSFPQYQVPPHPVHLFSLSD